MSQKALASSNTWTRIDALPQSLLLSALCRGPAARARAQKCRQQRRNLSTQTASPRLDHETRPGPPKPAKVLIGHRAQQKQADKEFFVDLLSSAATKRDAKAFLSRLKRPPEPAKDGTSRKDAPSAPRSQQVNLGNLFGRARAVEGSPVFTQYQKEEEYEEQETLHVALVKISNVGELADSVLQGIAQTLSQLSRLSMAPCVVLEEFVSMETPNWRAKLAEQANRLASAIDNIHETGAWQLDNVLTMSDGRPEVFMRKLLLRPLRRGHIPIVMPIAYSAADLSAVSVSADETMLALTRECAGLNIKARPDDDPHLTAELLQQRQKQVSVDRIIVIDSTAGIPDITAGGDRHVFINLEQEYSPLQRALAHSADKNVSTRHSSNLTLLRDALELLPPSSSGLIASPTDAANPERTSQDSSEVSRVGTRRQKNALIHNLLTDKPAYSASLPQGRLGRSVQSAAPVMSSTFVKRGMPLTILPDPSLQPWTGDMPRLTLNDPRLDLSRLVYLIDDSFNRKLDVEHYLRRVNERIAGVIIAGEYEGGALLTWETPPGADPNDRSRLVPYLDKFAVLKRSQGAGGVADIVFNAMVRNCFPTGVCWRSRKDNPVNKWYFERSRGTWKIPEMNWTMFWTTPGVIEASQTFSDYEAVCRGVEPSWADKKHPAD